MGSFLKQPLEILDAIAAQLNQDDLLVFATTCKAFQSSATRALYAFPSLRYPSACPLFFESVRQHPDLRSVVRRIDLAEGAAFSRWLQDSGPALYNLQLPNCATLIAHPDPSESIDPGQQYIGPGPELSQPFTRARNLTFRLKRFASTLPNLRVAQFSNIWQIGELDFDLPHLEGLHLLEYKAPCHETAILFAHGKTWLRELTLAVSVNLSLFNGYRFSYEEIAGIGTLPLLRKLKVEGATERGVDGQHPLAACVSKLHKLEILDMCIAYDSELFNQPYPNLVELHIGIPGPPMLFCEEDEMIKTLEKGLAANHFPKLQRIYLVFYGKESAPNPPKWGFVLGARETFVTVEYLA